MPVYTFLITSAKRGCQCNTIQGKILVPNGAPPSEVVTEDLVVKVWSGNNGGSCYDDTQGAQSLVLYGGTPSAFDSVAWDCVVGEFHQFECLSDNGHPVCKYWRLGQEICF